MGKHSIEIHKSHKSEKSHKHSKHSHRHDEKESKHRKSSKSSKHKRHSDSSDFDSSDSDIDDPNHRNSKFEKLNEDDYFLKMIEFRVWMKISKNISFEDSPGEECRKMFLKEFVPLYNKHKLPDMYYNGIPSDIKNECIKSKHTWKMKLTDNEIEQLATTADEVDITTETSKASSWKHAPSDKHAHGGHKEDHNSYKSKQSKDYSMGDGNHEASYYGPSSSGPHSGGRGEDRANDRSKGRAYQHQVRDYLEEIAPSTKSGRERMIDQKQERSLRTHAASRDREDQLYGGVGMSDSDLYGSTSSDFAAAKARLEHAKNRKFQSENEKLQAHSERENETIAKFKEQLGYNDTSGRGGRAMVPPRT